MILATCLVSLVGRRFWPTVFSLGARNGTVGGPKESNTQSKSSPLQSQVYSLIYKLNCPSGAVFDIFELQLSIMVHMARDSWLCWKKRKKPSFFKYHEFLVWTFLTKWRTVVKRFASHFVLLSCDIKKTTLKSSSFFSADKRYIIPIVRVQIEKCMAKTIYNCRCHSFSDRPKVCLWRGKIWSFCESRNLSRWKRNPERFLLRCLWKRREVVLELLWFRQQRDL